MHSRFIRDEHKDINTLISEQLALFERIKNRDDELYKLNPRLIESTIPRLLELKDEIRKSKIHPAKTTQLLLQNNSLLQQANKLASQIREYIHHAHEEQKKLDVIEDQIDSIDAYVYQKTKQLLHLSSHSFLSHHAQEQLLFFARIGRSPGVYTPRDLLKLLSYLEEGLSLGFFSRPENREYRNLRSSIQRMLCFFPLMHELNQFITQQAHNAKLPDDEQAFYQRLAEKGNLLSLEDIDALYGVIANKTDPETIDIINKLIAHGFFQEPDPKTVEPTPNGYIF